MALFSVKASIITAANISKCMSSVLKKTLHLNVKSDCLESVTYYIAICLDISVSSLLVCTKNNDFVKAFEACSTYIITIGRQITPCVIM